MASKYDDEIFALEMAAILLAIAPTDPDLIAGLADAVDAARDAGMGKARVQKIIEESADVGADLVATLSQLGSVTIEGTTFTPTKAARKRAQREGHRLKKKYGPKRKRRR